MDTNTDTEEKKPTECTWRVDEEDETKYNFSDKKGLWQPKPEDILSMFEKLAKGGSLPLSWQCPGRRPPTSEEPNEKEAEMEMEVDDDKFKEEYRDPEPSAFDFDDSQSDINTKVTPWRSHAGMARTPKTEKRVARMDTIMDSLRKQQIQRAAEREARKAKASPSQQGKGRLIKFGSPNFSKVSASTAPKSSSSSFMSPTSSQSESPIPDTVSLPITVPTSSVFVTAPTSKSPKPGYPIGTVPLPGVNEFTDKRSEPGTQLPETDRNDFQMTLDVNTTSAEDGVKEGVSSNHNSSRTLPMTTSSSSDSKEQTSSTPKVSGHQVHEKTTEFSTLQTASSTSATITSTSNSYPAPSPKTSSTSSTAPRPSEIPNAQNQNESSSHTKSSKPSSESFSASKDASGADQQTSNTLTVSSGVDKRPVMRTSLVADFDVSSQANSSATTTIPTDFVLISSGPTHTKKISPDATATAVTSSSASSASLSSQSEPQD